MRALPEIAVEDDFALKGGTAINLFVRNLPRLSVDIDLVYLPVAEREASLDAIRSAFGRIAGRIRERVRAKVDEQTSADGKRLVVRLAGAQIKIELSPVLRGTVFAPELRQVSSHVEDRFGYAEIQVVSFPDLYGGKIAAALDRQHPRDLFDVHHLYENEGVTDDLFTAFLVYLISHNRPPHELLAPNLHDVASEYEGEFAGMTVEPVALDVLIGARSKLIEDILGRARKPDASGFLMSFYEGQPDWSLLRIETEVAVLPAVMWKQRNLERLRTEQPDKFSRQLAALTKVLE
ncbi:MAG: nucleotidyl transferase AbiEii/AbiGii toxin family protein [Allopontixanthobacter sediminis]